MAEPMPCQGAQQACQGRAARVAAPLVWMLNKSFLYRLTESMAGGPWTYMYPGSTCIVSFFQTHQYPSLILTLLFQGIVLDIAPFY